MISNNFAPEINLNLDFDFRSKGITIYKFGGSGTFLLMPDKNDFFKVNSYSFINVYYGLGFRDKWDHKVSIGYMLSGSGNDFSKNTWNAYWQSNINKIGIKVGAYYTNNLEGNRVILPSIGFDFGF
jgi:hypothetical protein